MQRHICSLGLQRKFVNGEGRWKWNLIHVYIYRKCSMCPCRSDKTRHQSNFPIHTSVLWRSVCIGVPDLEADLISLLFISSMILFINSQFLWLRVRCVDRFIEISWHGLFTGWHANKALGYLKRSNKNTHLIHAKIGQI